MILGIESSCDESALSLFCPARGIVFERVHTQIALHQEYGGVVPDLASREHLHHFPLLFAELQKEHDLSQVEQIAVTTGPGLAACLAIGIAWAKSTALLLHKPAYAVNHLRGHVFSPFLPLHAKHPENFAMEYNSLLPQLHLLVSGGNTLLLEIDEQEQICVLAQTIDDAAGEALDKGGKLLGLPYPAGPILEKESTSGNDRAFDFPRAFRDKTENKFSFSGLKTSLRYQLEKMDEPSIRTQFSDLCASYQRAVIEALVHKTRQFLDLKPYRSIALSGGVSNNELLRKRCAQLAQKKALPILLPEKRHTGDNASMIAFAQFMDKLPRETSALTVRPNWTVDER